MLPECRSPQTLNPITAAGVVCAPTEVHAASPAMAGEAVPPECPGVFVEQPLERWSSRDLIVGVFRLMRWTRLATS